jgi:tetratricopeptide (TPR) repeat protein
LQLFIQVCNAVQHAHQKGIIHRDLKPSNIMVTMHDGVPVPKVIDFGIAKATEQRLTDKTLFTSYAQLMGTPAYMSPEQMELSGLNLDTRSDIYSLGILLYELLTGRTPFDTRDLLRLGVEELRRTVCEREPLSPSAKLKTLTNEELTKTARSLQVEAPRLVTQLRGDLDWIVLKCLEKDRTRRYATAIGLAEDIERYLHEEAVLARPPSQLYRLHKLVRRNPMVFASGAVTVAALLAGSIISTSLFIKERAALKIAVAARQEAESARILQAQLQREAETREVLSRVGMLVAEKEYERADELLERIPLQKPSFESQTLLRKLGDWNALNGRWPKAIARFELLTRLDPTDDRATLDYFRLGVALVEGGRRDDYHRFQEQSLSRLGSVASKALPDRLIKTCLLLPANQQVLENLRPAAEAGESELTGVSLEREPWIASALALWEYRRGNDLKASSLCARCLDSRRADHTPAALARTVLALACRRLNQPEKGLIALKQAEERIDLAFNKEISRTPTNSGDYWFDWFLVRILLREYQEQPL